MNYLLDILIILVVIFYLLNGYRSGFIKNFLDLLGFIIAAAIAYLSNNFISNLFTLNLPLPLSLSKIIAFLIVWLLIDIICSIAIFFTYRKIPEKFKDTSVNKILGILPAFFKAAIIILLFLIFLSSIPTEESLKLKKGIDDSKIAKFFLNAGSILDSPYQNVFGKGIDDLVNFFTLPPQSNKVISLNYNTKNIIQDESSEDEMLKLVNQEREKLKLSELKMDEQLRKLARDHAEDMFSRGYFSHYTPEGLSPFERMNNSGISYLFAGENLALAPNTDKAQKGLMDSPGHRENILNPNFNKIGIGVIDGGIYGKMFVQEFTN